MTFKVITVDGDDHLLANNDIFSSCQSNPEFSVVPLNKTVFEHEQECFQPQHFFGYHSATTAYMIFSLKTSLTGQCKTQTTDYCFYHANEYVTTIVPLFSNPKSNSPQWQLAVCVFHCPLNN